MICCRAKKGFLDFLSGGVEKILLKSSLVRRRFTILSKVLSARLSGRGIRCEVVIVCSHSEPSSIHLPMVASLENWARSTDFDGLNLISNARMR